MKHKVYITPRYGQSSSFVANKNLDYEELGNNQIQISCLVPKIYHHSKRFCDKLPNIIMKTNSSERYLKKAISNIDKNLLNYKKDCKTNISYTPSISNMRNLKHCLEGRFTRNTNFKSRNIIKCGDNFMLSKYNDYNKRNSIASNQSKSQYESFYKYANRSNSYNVKL